ncbi:MAG: ABC transporter permease, partial [Planctomycetota bacterium]
MTFARCVRTIYRKELVDILRDRRTLIAMIVVPIVLYPLLMLGSIQAVSFQTEKIGDETVLIGVLNETQGRAVDLLINLDRKFAERAREQSGEDKASVADGPAPITKYKIYPLGSREALEQRVRDRSIHLGVILDRDTLVNDPAERNGITLLADTEDMRSAMALERFKGVLERTKERTVRRRKQAFGLPPTFDQPFELKVADLSSPPSILGQVLPLILILMTITGAIYPAIDLTAGERERGTLESLMVSPVSTVELIVGKFLVVTTVAILGAALNLASVTATVYFGGFETIIATTGGTFPIGTMIVILLCLVPFAVLMSAVMIAVCSFARTFKEAQNYVTPVILAVLIPGGIAALPATRLEGIMLVMPVGNMVLLARDFLVGAVIPGRHIAVVLLSTSLYAAAAVAVAAGLFGKESVVFTDAGSWRRLFSRALMRPTRYPAASFGLLLTALLFPTWFFVQAAFGPKPGEDASRLLYATGMLMPVLFVALPVGLMVYARIDVRETLQLHRPAGRHLLAALCLGASAWVPAHLLAVLQQRWIGMPEAMLRSAEQFADALRALPLSSAVVLVAFVPA